LRPKNIRPQGGLLQGRDRVPVCRTINCREQLISAQGCLECEQQGCCEGGNCQEESNCRRPEGVLKGSSPRHGLMDGASN